ncbi:hypothetical protein [Nocardioides marmoraquaticus]
MGGLLGAVAAFGYRVANTVEVFMSQLCLYVVAAVLAGLWASDLRQSRRASTTLLLSMCIVYYVPFATNLDYYLLGLLPFGALSLVSGPVFGYLGHPAHDAGLRTRRSLAGRGHRVAVWRARPNDAGGVHTSRVRRALAHPCFDAAVAVALVCVFRRSLTRSFWLTVPCATAAGYAVALVLR